MGNDNGERIMPTRAGWWWGIPKTWNEDRETQAIRVAQSPYSNDLLASGLASVGVWLEDVEWLAPIYGPAVCAALADCEAAELAWANGDLDDELLERAVTNAEARLYAAMRAERDGAA